MKTLISLVICVCLLHLSLAENLSAAESKPAQTTAKQADPSTAILWWAILAAVAAGTYIIIKIYASQPNLNAEVTVILEISQDHATWSEITRKTVMLNGQQPIEIFRKEMTDPAAFYRARVVKPD